MINERVHVNLAPTPVTAVILLIVNFKNTNYACFLVELVRYDHFTTYVEDWLFVGSIFVYCFISLNWIHSKRASYFLSLIGVLKSAYLPASPNLLVTVGTV